jgi:hypothetical protein
MPFIARPTVRRRGGAREKITREWLMDMTATTYSYATVADMAGETIKAVLEDVADTCSIPIRTTRRCGRDPNRGPAP